MQFPRFLPFMAALAAALTLTGTGCIFSPDEGGDPPPPPEAFNFKYTPPDSLLINLQTIYNDKEHSARERRDVYQTLFLQGDSNADPPVPGFIFRFQPADIANGLPESWGLDAEVAAHEGLFNAQENGDIYSLQLAITRGPATLLDPPQAGREKWMEIFASNVYLRLMFNPNDGLEVNGGQAEFQFAPDLTKPIYAVSNPDSIATYGQYWVGEWKDLPRP